MPATVVRGVIYSGHGAPTGNIGLPLDYYLDLDTYNFYGPKINISDWDGANVISLIGPQGEQGITGATGPTGPAGTTWHSGAGVPSGGLGANGDYYLDTSSGDVYTKTSGSWGSPIENLIGPTGPQGEKGDTGDQGPTGDQGETGATGTAGSKWYEGSGVPSNGLGANGDFYLNTANGDVYTKSAGSWGSPVDNLTGPEGDLNTTHDFLLTGDGSLPAAPGTAGIGLGVESDNGNPHIELVAPDNGTPYIDFTTPGTDYKARISYEDASGNFKLATGSSLIDMSSGSVQIYGNSTGLTVNSDGAQLTGGTLTINSSYSLPATDGSSGQILITDGSGNVTWQTNSAVDPIGLIIALG